MAVIINDFEIVSEPAPAPVEAARGPSKPEGLRLRPEDVIRIQRHERTRLERVWAS